MILPNTKTLGIVMLFSGATWAIAEMGDLLKYFFM